MNLNKSFNYSLNFNLEKRRKSQIKFLIFHYTGMKKESQAIKRLTSAKSKVSSHYLIKNNGEIVVMVPDLYISWHAGISYWKKFKFLNRYSIGIEISNPGHQNRYKKFNQKQINSILKLTKFLMSKFKLKPKNILGHSDIAPTRKKDPGEKFPWKLFAKKRIGIWHSLSMKKLKQSRLKLVESKEEIKFFKNLTKIGYVFNNSENLRKKIFLKLLIKSFQRRFRQELINGIIDQECLLISKNIAKKFK
tara:strand:- start:90 stop:833 length:744 start_codon:yes stop_codon:yes gene_type:complete